MRNKVLSFVLLAGTVVGCASNPPPPPPMASAPPPPPPAPMMAGPFDGLYRGTPTLADGASPRCAKPRPTTVRVLKNSTFVMMGVKGTISPDGTVTAAARRGTSLTGTAGNGTLTLTSTRGACTYNATLTKA